MSAAGAPFKSPATGQAPTAETTGPAASGQELAQDFQKTYGSGESRPGQHFNKVTQQWEDENAHVVSQTQDASTGPEQAQPGAGREPSFMERVAGQAKVFRGKTFGQEHEVAKGEALLQGHGLDKAKEIGEQVKQSQS